MEQSTLMCDTEQVFMSTLQMIQKLNLFQQTVLGSKTLSLFLSCHIRGKVNLTDYQGTDIYIKHYGT